VSIAELLNDLRRRDVRIEVHEDRLKFDAPTGTLTAELRDTLRSRKQEILEFLSRASAIARQQPAIVPLNARGARPPVFGVPGHNGDVFCYRAFAAQLGEDQPFFGLQPPGLDGRSAPLTRVPELARYFAEQIRATRPQGPVVVAGFCAGGGIALELACQLQEAGTPVSLLAVFGSPFPKAYRFWSMLRIRCGNALERLRVHWRAARAGDRGLMQYALERGRAVSQARREAARPVDEPIAAARIHLENTTLRALKEYEPRRFDGRAVLFVPSEGWRRIGDYGRRWRTVAREYREFVGPEGCTGENILLDPHVATMAEQFKAHRPG
jgi:thioesterase domain-containing protein